MREALSTDGEGDSAKDLDVDCPRCRFKMTSIQACHLRCSNCGAELTCSDKGNFW